MKKRILIVMLLVISLLLLAACGSNSEEETKQDTEETAAVLAQNIEIAGHNDALYVGEEMQLSIIGEGEVIWSSSDESIAVVDADGLVKGIAPGEVSVTAALAERNDVKAETSIIVGEHVKKVALDKNSVTLLTGSDKADETLGTTIAPETALQQGVTYTSSDPQVVSVDESGRLHAVSPGSATITVKSEDETCEQEASCEVTVKQGVSSITLSETEATLYLGEKLTLGATVLPDDADDATYTWSSSDEAVAKVDDQGNVTPLQTGSARIICTANDGSGVETECSVKVVIGVQKITLDSNAVTILIGSNKIADTKIGCSVFPADSSFQNVVWSSSDESVVRVAEDGTLKGVAPGKATVTAVTTDPKMADRVKASCSVTVGNAVDGIKIEWGENTVAKGTTRRLNTSVSPSNAINPKLSWTSSNEKILSVDANGNIRALGVGKATITCKSTDGSEISTEHEFTVIQAVTAVTANERGNIVVFAGQSVTLHATVKPDDASNKKINWSSSDGSVASVDSSGNVTGKSQGTVKITATADDGSGRSCQFNVIVEPKLPITIDSLGFGVYNANLLGITVKNNCSRTTIKNFDFTIALYSYDGTKLSSSGSYSLGKDETIGAGATKTIKRTLSGVAWAQKIVITITGVKLADGSYYSIPFSDMKTWTFTR